MDQNQKQLLELATKLGLGGTAAKNAEGKARQFRNASDAELLAEMKRLKAGMKNDPTQINKTMQAARMLAAAMGPEQRKRLEYLLRELQQR